MYLSYFFRLLHKLFLDSVSLITVPIPFNINLAANIQTAKHFFDHSVKGHSIGDIECSTVDDVVEVPAAWQKV